MGRCIHRQSFLGKSNMSIEAKMQHNCKCLQTLHAYFLQRHSQRAQLKSERHPHAYTYWKTPCTPGCLACRAPPCWSSCLSVFVCAVRALAQEHAQAATDWQTDWLTGWQATAESELSYRLLKPRDRNPTAFCMWHGRLECEWVPCWHFLLSHCYNPAGARSKHTSWRSWYLPRLEAFWVTLYYCTWSDLFFLLSPSAKLQLFRALFREKQMELTGVSCKPITEAGLCGVPLLWLLASWILLQLFDNTFIGLIFGNITNK